jgi:hypothetical protein
LASLAGNCGSTLEALLNVSVGPVQTTGAADVCPTTAQIETRYSKTATRARETKDIRNSVSKKAIGRIGVTTYVNSGCSAAGD